jgi:hypothetical protein
MRLDIDAWSHLTSYVGPPCVDPYVCQLDPKRQSMLIPSAKALGHIRLYTGLKTADEIREEFEMEPDWCHVGAEHYEFKLGNIEYSDWLDWLQTWNPAASAFLREQWDDDDNTIGARAAKRLLVALDSELFDAKFGDCGGISEGDCEDCIDVYQKFVRACRLAAEGGLMTVR